MITQITEILHTGIKTK